MTEATGLFLQVTGIAETVMLIAILFGNTLRQFESSVQWAVEQKGWCSEETFLPSKWKAGLLSECRVYTCVSEVRRGKVEKQSVIMSESQNPIVRTFDPVRPRISAFEIHDWVHDQLRIPEQEVNMIQT
jgi:hypothetical protein